MYQKIKKRGGGGLLRWLSKGGQSIGWNQALRPKVSRFDIWMHIKRPPLLTAEELIHDYLPPLDVIMVWHAYMLNPT